MVARHHRCPLFGRGARGFRHVTAAAATTTTTITITITATATAAATTTTTTTTHTQWCWAVAVIFQQVPREALVLGTHFFERVDLFLEALQVAVVEHVCGVD